jgi:crotonobetainyl-CoA:carnitine CoA-transferase CaiB-like acyl-CoA transferase
VSAAATGGPLDGIRVLDFTAAMAGPTCTMLLADFGAEVLKVEPPQGESSRRWGTARFGPGGQFSGLFLALNRNKRSVVLDLKSAAAAAKLADLIRSSDVVVENFKPGVAERLGIGYEQVRAMRPEVVYCSISGFGHNGPLSERPGYDQLLQAYAGHLSITGEPDRPSVRIGPSAIDLLTGAHAAYGILLALRERDASGRGQRVETALYDSSIHLVTHYLADYTGSGRLPGKIGGGFAFLAPYGMFAARDREVYIGVGTDQMFARLCAALGCEHLVQDPRFATNAARVVHRAELSEELAPLLRDRPAAELVELCSELGIPASEVATLADVAEQEQALAREMIIPTGVEDVRTAGIPLKLDRTPGTIRRPPPELGADTEAVLGERAGTAEGG